MSEKMKKKMEKFVYSTMARYLWMALLVILVLVLMFKLSSFLNNSSSLYSNLGLNQDRLQTHIELIKGKEVLFFDFFLEEGSEYKQFSSTLRFFNFIFLLNNNFVKMDTFLNLIDTTFTLQVQFLYQLGFFVKVEENWDIISRSGMLSDYVIFNLYNNTSGILLGSYEIPIWSLRLVCRICGFFSENSSLELVFISPELYEMNRNFYLSTRNVYYFSNQISVIKEHVF